MGKLYPCDDDKWTSLLQSLPPETAGSVQGPATTVNTDTDSEDSRFIRLLNKWKTEKMIREVERQIPDGILPAGFEGNMVDVTPATRGDDDNFFRKNDELRNHLPRGLSLLNTRVRGGQSECSVVIYANRKFFQLDFDSLSGKNSSTNGTFDQYFIGSASSATRVIAMEKINGEAAHFSGRFIKDQFYLIAGSKNVHLIFSQREHIELYTEERYSIAKQVAHTVLDYWNSMTQKKQLRLARFLHFTQRTVVCEIMRPTHQHIVDLRELSQNKLVILAVTGQPNETLKSLTAAPSEQTLKFFSSLGFHVPHVEILSPDKVYSHVLETRNLENSEGTVYYYEDCEGNTLGLVKSKTCWYVHLRALREQGANRHMLRKTTPPKTPPKTLEQSKERSRRRMKELQGWTYTSEQELEGWEILSDEWLEWLEGEVMRSTITLKQIKENFAYVWQRFQEQQDTRIFTIFDIIYS